MVKNELVKSDGNNAFGKNTNVELPGSDADSIYSGLEISERQISEGKTIDAREALAAVRKKYRL